ncbi:MAG TPA: CRTAC1 family protein [Patescibacteria group bacterium]|nr:CRTAC1 family protein [Patescibacteria group bacterium]
MKGQHSSWKPIAILGLMLALGAGVIVAFKNSVKRAAPAVSTGPVAALTLTLPISAAKDDLFEDVTAKAGIHFVNQYCDSRIANILESNGAGGVWFDYDGDGLMDLYLVNSGPLEGVTHQPPGTGREPNRLYRNKGDGTFEDVTRKAGVEGAGYGTAAIAADYDNDGHTDLYVIGVGRCILYHNRGDGTFEDVTEKAGVANTGGTGIGGVFVDVDNDGFLDLFVANYLTFDPSYQLYFSADAYPGPLSYKAQFNKLYRNRGNGTFEDVSSRAGIQIPGHRAMSVTVLDYNRDGAPDLYVSNDGTPNVLLVNDGQGHFKDMAPQAGVAFNAMGEAAGSMAATIGDCNGDGYDDIFVTRLGYGSLYLGNSKGAYDDRMMASGLGSLTAQFVGWGGCFLDFDNDGDLDIFIANGDAHYLVGWESLLLENTGNGVYVDAAEKGGAYFKTKVRARGSAVADFDNDGRMDVLVTTMGDRPFVLHNRDHSGNHWLTLDLIGTRSNRDGFGSSIKVTAGGKELFAEARCAFGFLMQSDRRPHFGLGKAAMIDRIQITWPSRQVQELTNIKADQILKVIEPGERK